MKRPELPHAKTFMVFAYLVSFSFLVGLMMMPDMKLIWISFVLFVCLVSYPLCIGLIRKYYLYSLFIFLLIIISGAGLYLLQTLLPQG